MPKIIITKQKVVQAAEALVDKGITPTLASVRQKLGNQGSLSTIHKHLKAWKEACFKKKGFVDSNEPDRLSVAEEKRALEQLLEQQRLQNQHYAKSLIQAEKALMQTKLDNETLTKESLQLQNQLKEALDLKAHYEVLCETIKGERQAFYHQELGEKNRLITLLQEELKTVNQHALTEVRDLGYARDEALIQEKVKIINLQEKVIQLSEENKKALSESNQLRNSRNEALKKLKVFEHLVNEQVHEATKPQYLSNTESLGKTSEGESHE